MQNDKIAPEQAYTSLLIIWAALVMSQVFFPVMVYFAKPELFPIDLRRPLLGEYAVEICTLGALSVVNLIVSFTIRQRFMGQAMATGRIDLVKAAVIFGCAMCELASLFGVLVAFVFDYQYFFLLSILGTIGTMLHFPRRADIHAASYKG